MVRGVNRRRSAGPVAGNSRPLAMCGRMFAESDREPAAHARPVASGANSSLDPMIRRLALAVLSLATLTLSPAADLAGQSGRSADGHTRLDTLFVRWRVFQRPRVVGELPDYSPTSMAAQKAALPAWMAKLRAIDTTGWSASQQINWHLVRAEMNGLDFDHRVLKPWAENPAFYVTVFAEQSDQPRREGPFAEGAVELWKHPKTFSPTERAAVTAGLSHVAPLLAQARRNLVGNRRDLWLYSSNALKEQEEALTVLLAREGSTSPMGLAATAARTATHDFAAWVAERAKSKTGASGIGIANYDWYLKNVQLVPLGYREVKALMERELGRAHTDLALEEQRNAALPPLVPVASESEFNTRFPAAVQKYVAILKERHLLDVRDWMVPALTARVGKYSAGPRAFFGEVDYRDPMVMRTHGFHWIDMERIAREPHASPIRSSILLYNIFDTRTEGFATAWEELMLQSGMFDASPRSRELIYDLVAQRAARALGELKMHGDLAPVTAAADFAVANTPHGWLRTADGLVWFEQHLYLQQPGYGISYLVGKMDVERTIQRRRQQLGAAFRLDQFMTEFERVGLIPMSLVRWELTGELPDDVRRMLSSATPKP